MVSCNDGLNPMQADVCAIREESFIKKANIGRQSSEPNGDRYMESDLKS